MPETRGSREDQREVSLIIEVDGQRVDTGIWDRKAGGGRKAASNKYRRGGMGEPFSLGGPADTENVTLTRDWDLTRDLPIKQFMEDAVGSGDGTITELYMNRRKLHTGKPVTIVGTLVEYNAPDHDSTSNNVALVSCVIEVSGTNSAQ